MIHNGALDNLRNVGWTLILHAEEVQLPVKLVTHPRCGGDL